VVGGGGRKWPKNWREREVATAELDRILGRQGSAENAAEGDSMEEEEEEEEVRGEEEKRSALGRRGRRRGGRETRRARGVRRK
jgi:hypothetical protein